ncbi:hypothetical protein SAMN05444722_1515 [Rhodovulum sp. ES.010]|uniref:hypothetical protein n=1 Tax=Rhodovulum sp. ES.010 TaxID=1882821 RepID=UPI00092BEF12|nr:hypothetical protein [Rhodovulum sp. ES.010]SIO33729.1 hypothetical protein SAMN05444722_1515 [Rhodovulum sp. ES.010]
MARYEWPGEFTSSEDRLVDREEYGLVHEGPSLPPGLVGDLDLLDEVINANFEEERLWMPLGPSILINGQATGDPVVSGRVRDIRISPNGDRIYVATANGGIWYSEDRAATWSPVGAWGLAPTAERSDISLTSGALLVEFGRTGGSDDPDKDVVYVGTGEPRPGIRAYPGAKLAGVGVLRLDGTITNALDNPGMNPWVREGRNLSGAGIYRLARDPSVTPSANGDGRFVAATTTGLWHRSGSFAEDSDWTRIDFSGRDFGDYRHAQCTDAVWTDRGLFVTLMGGDTDSENGVYWSPSGNLGDFQHITLPDLDPTGAREWGRRLSLGEVAHDTTRLYVLGKRASPVDPGNNKGHAHLWHIDVSGASPAVRHVRNVPVGLFVNSVTRSGGNLIIASDVNDQSNYDQTIAVRQVGSDDVVTVGGSVESGNAAIFDLTITTAAGNLTTDFQDANQETDNPPNGPDKDRTWVGEGIHADVHILRHAGATLWVGCDGGVFSRQGGTAKSHNSGLATAQTGYVAAHPEFDGPVLCGTQDNGAIQRIGDTVWELQRKGDGGGCMFHPTRAHLSVMQYIRGSWRFDPSATRPHGPVFRSGRGASGASETAENGRASFYSTGTVAPTDDPDNARVFIGTDRVWFSSNWNPDTSTTMDWVTVPSGSDPYTGGSDATQDQLTEGGSSDPVHVIEVLQGGDPADYDGMAIAVLCARTVRVFRFATASGWSSMAASVVSDDSGQERPKSKKLADNVPNPFLPYLPRPYQSAWTDIALHDNSDSGRETFYVSTTGQIRSQSDGGFSSDPVFDTLWWYDGHGRWYPTGLRNAPLNATAGTGGSAAGAHAVVVDPDARAIVYVGNRIGVWQGRIDRSGEHPAWTWKPAMEGLPQTKVEDLTVSQSAGGTYLRAALNARGVWERDISAVPASVGRTFIRSLLHDTGRLVLPAAPTDPLTNAPVNYHSSPDIVVLNIGDWTETDPPNEADLHTIAKPAAFSKALHEAYVMVHHRHTTPVPGGQVDVNVFLHKNAPAGDLGAVSIDAAWRTAILETVRGNSPSMPSDLEHVGLFHPGSQVDARTPRAVQVPVDLRFSGSNDDILVIAVVTSPDNALPATDLDHPTLKDIVRRSGQIAVRKIHRTT